MISGKMIITFPAIFERIAFDVGDEAKWGAGFLVNKKDKKTIDGFMPEILKAYKRGVKKGFWDDIGYDKVKNNFRYQPLRDGDKEHKTNGGEKDSPEYLGHFFFSSGAGSKDADQPGVVDQTGQKLLDASQLFSGRIVRADLGAFPYNYKGNKGIGWWLKNVMVFLNDECARLDGKQDAEDAFTGFTESEEDLS